MGPHELHLKVVQHLSAIGQPASVIAASDIGAGGRVVNDLKALLPDPRQYLHFSGDQTPSTPSRAI